MAKIWLEVSKMYVKRLGEGTGSAIIRIEYPRLVVGEQKGDKSD